MTRDNIESYNALENGWDGYDGKAIEQDVINYALVVLDKIPEDKQPQVFPTGRNTIQFEWEKDNGKYLEFEINDSIIMMLSIDEDKNEIEKEVLIDEIEELVKQF